MAPATRDNCTTTDVALLGKDATRQMTLVLDSAATIMLWKDFTDIFQSPISGQGMLRWRRRDEVVWPD